MRNKTISFLALFLCLTAGFLNGNAANSSCKNVAGLPDASWTKDTVIASITCYHKVVHCDDEDVVLFAFLNTSGNNVTISWKDSLLLDNASYTSTATRTFTATPGVSMQATCDGERTAGLFLTATALGNKYASVSAYKFIDISTN